jgi:hypothetical protein
LSSVTTDGNLSGADTSCHFLAAITGLRERNVEFSNMVSQRLSPFSQAKARKDIGQSSVVSE